MFRGVEVVEVCERLGRRVVFVPTVRWPFFAYVKLSPCITSLVTTMSFVMIRIELFHRPIVPGTGLETFDKGTGIEFVKNNLVRVARQVPPEPETIHRSFVARKILKTVQTQVGVRVGVVVNSSSYAYIERFAEFLDSKFVAARRQVYGNAPGGGRTAKTGKNVPGLVNVFQFGPCDSLYVREPMANRNRIASRLRVVGKKFGDDRYFGSLDQGNVQQALRSSARVVPYLFNQ